MTLNKQGLEAAHAAYERYGHTGDLRTQRLSDGCVSAVITAYLAAVSNSEERRRRAAGPSEVKWPMPDPLKKYKDADQTEPDGLVERLQADAAQLIRMSKATEFGKDLSVRVKAPDLLIASLTEAATVIQTLQRERDAAVAALNSIVNMQSSVTRAQFREAAADALESIGCKPIGMTDQSPFIIRAEAAEQQVREMSEVLRCHVTGNPPGTDTRRLVGVGTRLVSSAPCSCPACRLLLKEGGE